jgi:hypothetical protein
MIVCASRIKGILTETMIVLGFCSQQKEVEERGERPIEIAGNHFWWPKLSK